RYSLRPPGSLSIVPSTTRIVPLSLHDALPILKGRTLTGYKETLALARLAFGDVPVREIGQAELRDFHDRLTGQKPATRLRHLRQDRKSTRLNSSHEWISYAVFCLKKKNKTTKT